jgi:hypothetical protein
VEEKERRRRKKEEEREAERERGRGRKRGGEREGERERGIEGETQCTVVLKQRKSTTLAFQATSIQEQRSRHAHREAAHRGLRLPVGIRLPKWGSHGRLHAWKAIWRLHLLRLHIHWYGGADRLHGRHYGRHYRGRGLHHIPSNILLGGFFLRGVHIFKGSVTSCTWWWGALIS